MDRQKWGLAGLLAFEALIAAYLAGVGVPLLSPFPLMYAVGAATLALALWRGPQRWHYAVLGAASLYRAYLQTANGAAWGIYPTYLVPLGFAWLAIAPGAMPRAAIASVALARTWFIGWYFLGGSTLIAAANILGAAGAWLWWSGEGAERAPPTELDEGAAVPPRAS